MRSLFTSLLVASAVLAASAPVLAQAADEPLKLAYVDLNIALNSVEDGKAAKAKLKSEFDAKQKKIDGMLSELKKGRDEFEKQAGTMKQDIKMQKAEDLQRKYMELQQTAMQLQQELLASEQKVTQEIGEKIKKIIDKVGDRDGYNLILNIGGDSVLYYKRHKDLTDIVIKEYNQQHSSPTASKK